MLHSGGFVFFVESRDQNRVEPGQKRSKTGCFRHPRSTRRMGGSRARLGATPEKKMPTERGWHLDTGGQGQNRTADTRIFSPLLYQLSYLAKKPRIISERRRTVKKSADLMPGLQSGIQFRSWLEIPRVLWHLCLLDWGAGRQRRGAGGQFHARWPSRAHFLRN